MLSRVRAQRGSKYKGKVELTGLGTPNHMRQYVKNGTIEGFELWDPAKLGDLAARTAVALVSRQDRLAEYRERHAALWPEMRAARYATGWHNSTGPESQR
ncbi:substrate-binding domain-containing protein [Streptomyces sp. 900105755]